MVILHGKFVIGADLEILSNHGVVLDEDRIALVAPIKLCMEAYPSVPVIDKTDSVISPGLINAHMHCYGVLAHGITPPVPIHSFKGFLEDYWWPLVENQLDAPLIATATAYSTTELIESGVTTLCDVLEAPMAHQGLFAEAEVLDAIGIRAIVSTEACERISYEKGLECLQENSAVAKAYKNHPNVGAMMCTHTAFTCSQAFMEKALELAIEADISLQFHLNESIYEPTWVLEHHGVRTCNWYDSFHLLDANILAAQGVQLDEKEIEILAKRGVRMVHVPLSNCEVGGGVSPVPELLENHIVCGLGTDGYINNFFEVMRGAFLIHKGHRANPSVMSAKTVWKMATELGAQAVFGPNADVGKIEKGMKADIMVINIESLPTPANSDNLFDQMILYRNPKDVSDVIVNGVFLKKEGGLTYGDREEMRKNASLAAQQLWEKGSQLAMKRNKREDCGK